MTRGRNPLPIHDAPDKRQVERLAEKVAPLTEFPPPPDWLSPIAIEEWEKVVPGLLHIGTLTELDLTNLAMYCQTFAEWLELTKIVQNEGAIALRTEGTLNKDGTTTMQHEQYEHPAVKMAARKQKDLISYARLFGLTPSHRRRKLVNRTESEGEKQFMEFLTKRSRADA